MSNSDTEVKGENISIKITKQPGCQVTLDVAVTPKAAQAAYRKAVKAVNKEVSLPGFRKGKAPEAMIIQNFNQYVEQDWKQILVETTFSEALNLAKLSPFSENSMKKPDIKKVSKEEGAEIAFHFESHPSIPDVDFSKISLSAVEKKTIDQKQVEDAFQDVLINHGEWDVVKDRPVEEGDFVDVDIVNCDQNDKQICKDSRFHVCDGKMGDWMRKLVIGLKAGEHAEGISEKEDKDSDAPFTPTKCKITVKEIFQARPAEPDEKFLEKIGVKSVEDLKERIEKDLIKQADEAVQQKLRNQLEDHLIAEYPFEIPKSLVDSEANQRFSQEISTLGSSPSKEQSAELKEKIEKEVEEAFRLFFLSRSVAEKENLDVDQQEVLSELMMQMYSPGGQNLFSASSDPGEVRSRIYVQLLSQKAKDFMIEKATIK